MRMQDRGARSPDRPLPYPRTTLLPPDRPLPHPRTTLPQGPHGRGGFRARVRGINPAGYVLVVVLVVGALYASWAQLGHVDTGPQHLPQPMHQPMPQPRIGTASGGPVQDAERWARTNLPSGARIGVDAHAARGLSSGPLVVDVFARGGAVRRDDFVLSTPTLRVRAGRASAALRSSLPIATFGTGAAEVEVREVAAQGVVTLLRSWHRHLTMRRLAGIRLLRNARVHASDSARGLLRRGALDLRACVLVSRLAARTGVRVVAIARDQNEIAGRPARTLTLSMSNPGTALPQVLAITPRKFRPVSVVALAGDVRRLRWDVATAPVPTLDSASHLKSPGA